VGTRRYVMCVHWACFHCNLASCTLNWKALLVCLCSIEWFIVKVVAQVIKVVTICLLAEYRLANYITTSLCYVSCVRYVASQGSTNFPKFWVPPETSGRQKGGTKQIPYWGLTDIRRYRTKFRRLGDQTSGIYALFLTVPWCELDS
jgi:hypothetical protein